MKIALCQINPTVGDLEANARLILAWAQRACNAGADLAIFPELSIIGYPPEDLLLRFQVLKDARQVVDSLAAEMPLTALVGFPEVDESGSTRSDPHRLGGKPHFPVYNSCAVIDGGEIIATYRKQLLPNYAVFDEHRYFEQGDEALLIDLHGKRCAITICEDLWVENGPAYDAADLGAEMILNISASPYFRGRGIEREAMVRARARDTQLPIIVCNQVGGQDELVFDGHSLAVDAVGTVVARGKHCAEDHVIVDVHDFQHQGENATPQSSTEEEIYGALQLGLRDYVIKNGFSSVVLGLSGGIDSALVAVLAVDAIGSSRVHSLTMPFRYTSSDTHADAIDIAHRLGILIEDISIEPIFDAFTKQLPPTYAEGGITEQNLQARIRGTLLMAVSNECGHLLLTTGNKSEVSVGYMTLYGDMAGGFAPIKDLPKTLVYALCNWRNELSRGQGLEPPIPQTILDRPPSAELRPDQLDSDSLPAYDVLDAILQLYVEEDHGRDEVVSEGFDAVIVDRVIAMVDRAEYKRRQAPPGIRITPKAFGRDRRMPITNRYRHTTPVA